LIEQQIEHQERTNELLTALLEAFKNAPPPVVQVVTPEPPSPVQTPPLNLESPVKSDFTATLQVTDKKTPSPKLLLAIEWLLANPQDMKETTRKVGEKIQVSHTWVAQAKKLIESGEYKEVLASK
jgi:hypothetical protein